MSDSSHGELSGTRPNMAEKKPPDELVPIEERSLADKPVSVEGFFVPATRSYVERRFIADMTPEAATAKKEVARYTYAVPAEQATRCEEEKTKQEKEVTKRTSIDSGSRLLFGSFLAVLAYHGLNGHPKTFGLVLVGLAGLFAGKELVGAVEKLVEVIKKKMD